MKLCVPLALFAVFTSNWSYSSNSVSNILEDDRPNILFILVDDLGKEWVSTYGAEHIKTPNIDRLAATGMKFENAYVMPQCTPTRPVSYTHLTLPTNREV